VNNGTQHGWVTFEEALGLTGLSRSSLFRYQREQLVTRRIGKTCRNGKPRRLILVDSLPAYARDLYRLRCRAAGVSHVELLGDIPGFSYSDLNDSHTVHHG